MDPKIPLFKKSMRSCNSIEKFVCVCLLGGAELSQSFKKKGGIFLNVCARSKFASQISKGGEMRPNFTAASKHARTLHAKEAANTDSLTLWPKKEASTFRRCSSRVDQSMTNDIAYTVQASQISRIQVRKHVCILRAIGTRRFIRLHLYFGT